MTNAQMAVDRNAITLQGDGLDLDLLLPDINWELDFDAPRPAPRARGAHVAREADITLASDDSLLGFGPADGIGSSDFQLDVDLGLDFGDVPISAAGAGGVSMDDDSIEQGRDAAPSRAARDSFASGLFGRAGNMDVDFDALSARTRESREPSEQPFGADMNLDFGMDVPMDLGIDFGDVPPAPPSREKTPGQTRSPSEQFH
jgi:cohesin complex subunit SCC1